MLPVYFSFSFLCAIRNILVGVVYVIINVVYEIALAPIYKFASAVQSSHSLRGFVVVERCGTHDT